MNYKSYKLPCFSLLPILYNIAGDDGNPFLKRSEIKSIYNDLKNNKAYIAGGFARVIALKYFGFSNKFEPFHKLRLSDFSDIDFYFPKITPKVDKDFKNNLNYRSRKDVYQSSEKIDFEQERSCLYKQSSMLTFNILLFIHGDICDVLDSFDISTSQCAVDIVNNRLIVREDFVELETKRIIRLNEAYWKPDLTNDKIGVSLSRIYKYITRLTNSNSKSDSNIVIENFVNTMMMLYNKKSRFDGSIRIHMDLICDYLSFEDKIKLQMLFDPTRFANKIVENWSKATLIPGNGRLYRA